MSVYISYIFIPLLTLLLPGNTNWFTSNFSVSCAVYPQNILLLLWTVLTGSFFRETIKQIIGQTTPFLSVEKEMILTDLAAILLVASAFLPYLPETRPKTAFFHLTMAFSSTVLFFSILTSLNIKLSQFQPELFILPFVLLMGAAVVSLILLISCNFLISSCLEIFLTLFSCYWLPFFSQRVLRLNEIRT